MVLITFLPIAFDITFWRETAEAVLGQILPLQHDTSAKARDVQSFPKSSLFFCSFFSPFDALFHVLDEKSVNWQPTQGFIGSLEDAGSNPSFDLGRTARMP